MRSEHVFDKKKKKMFVPPSEVIYDCLSAYKSLPAPNRLTPAGSWGRVSTTFLQVFMFHLLFHIRWFLKFRVRTERTWNTGSPVYNTLTTFMGDAERKNCSFSQSPKKLLKFGRVPREHCPALLECFQLQSESVETGGSSSDSSGKIEEQLAALWIQLVQMFSRFYSI